MCATCIICGTNSHGELYCGSCKKTLDGRVVRGTKGFAKENLRGKVSKYTRIFDDHRSKLENTVEDSYLALDKFVDKFRKTQLEGLPYVTKVSGSIEEYFNRFKSDDPLVFMCFKTLPVGVKADIIRFGIFAEKFRKYGAEGCMRPFFVQQKGGHWVMDCTPAIAARKIFLRSLVAKRGGLTKYITSVANAHKSGSTDTSGFHSTTLKPDYAVSPYSLGYPMKVGDKMYNMAAAIKITKHCFPVIVYDAVKSWNQSNPTEKMKLAFKKKGLKSDWESEILLGGATPPTDIPPPSPPPRLSPSRMPPRSLR